MTDVLQPDPLAPPSPPDRGPPEATGYLRRVFRATEDANCRAVLSALPVGGGGRLLDIGTHDGAFTARIVERVRPGQVTGVEVMAEHARHARGRGVDVVEADVEDGLPFPDGRFDLVTANQVIEHLRHTDVLLSEVRRVLAPGGLACISTNNLCSWHNVVSPRSGTSRRRCTPPTRSSSATRSTPRTAGRTRTGAARTCACSARGRWSSSPPTTGWRCGA